MLTALTLTPDANAVNMPSVTSTQRAYHHGDLRNALIDAATELAVAGGPEAIVLREAARRVGVSPTAAYRHFAAHADLVQVVKAQALGALARTIRVELADLTPTGEPVTDALERLRVTGAGYLRFAFDHPGLFRVAFDRRGEPDGPPGPPHDDDAYSLLAAAIDGLVACGRVPPERRPHAETAAWAAVHGLALLLLDGPLRALPDEQRAQAIQRTFDMVLRGI